MESSLPKSLPAIASDIDGVLYTGHKLVGNSPNVLEALANPFPGSPQVKIPLVLLTNGGGQLEKEKAEIMNKKLELSEGAKLAEEQIVVCHTPLRDKEFQKSLGDKYVLVEGWGTFQYIVDDYCFEKYILLDELRVIYPTILGFVYGQLSPEYSEELKKGLEARTKMTVEELSKELSFSAIVIFCAVKNSDVAAQIFCDLLGSKDGTILGERRKPGDPQVVKFVNTNNDLVYADNWPIPRFGPRRLILFIDSLLKEYYGCSLEVIHFGKPEQKSFHYAQNQLLQQLQATNSQNNTACQISNYYMIGDNPFSDIEGGKRMGWTTFLVRTGIFKEGEEANGATYVVEDLNEAVRKIFELEGIQIPEKLNLL